MRYENNERLRSYLDRGAAGAYREHMRHPRFVLDAVAFASALDDVRTQHPQLTADEAEARAVFRLLTMGAPPEIAAALPSQWYRANAWLRRVGPRAWPWVKIGWALALLVGVATLLLIMGVPAHGEPRPEPRTDELRAIRNAMAGWRALPQQPNGLLIQFQNGGTVLATRPAGLVAINCSTGTSCSFSGNTFTVTSTGGGGGGSSGFDALTSATNTTATMHVGSGATLDFTGTGVLNANRIRGQAWSATSPSNGHIPIWNSTNTDWEPGDPIVSGPDVTGIAPTKNPVQTGALDNSTACSSGPCVRSLVVANSAPAGSEYGLIVRNVPNGTQAVSIGATVNVAAASLPLPSGAATSVKQPALGTAGSAATDIITVQGIAGMTKLLVTPDANSSVNQTQWNGTTVDTNSGNKSAGTLRVVLATDQPQLTNKLLVTPDANSAVNVAQVGGSNVATAAAGIAKVGMTDGAGTGYVADPCEQQLPTALGINQAATGPTTIIAGVSAKKTYICSLNLVTATAQNINVVAGTGTNCGTTVHLGFFGGTTAATGWNFSANGGVALSGGGKHIAGGTETAADNICVISSSTGQISGSVTYVQQ